MLIFNITTKPENFVSQRIDDATAEASLRIWGCNYKKNDETHTILKIIFPITDDNVLTAYMQRYRRTYFVVKDENLITEAEKRLDINIVNKRIDNVIKPFEYSGSKDLTFKKDITGKVNYDGIKKQIRIDVKIDSSQLGKLPCDKKMNSLIIEEKDIDKLTKCGFLKYENGDYKVIGDYDSEFVITDINPGKTFFVLPQDVYHDHLKLESFGEILKKSDYEAQKNKEKEEKKTNLIPKFQKIMIII